MELPEDEDGLAAAGEEVRAVRGKGERRDGVRVPVQDRRTRLVDELGVVARRRARQDVVPDPDLTLLVTGRKDVLGRVERKAGHAPPVLLFAVRSSRASRRRGLDALGEPLLDVRRLAQMHVRRRQRGEGRAGGGEGERPDVTRDGEADAARRRNGRRGRGGAGRSRGGAARRGRGRPCRAETDDVDSGEDILTGSGRHRGRSCQAPLALCSWGALGNGCGRFSGGEGDKELIGELVARSGMDDGRSEFEGTEEGPVDVVPDADAAVGRADDELARVRRRQKDGGDGRPCQASALMSRCGRRDGQSREELGRLDGIDADGGAGRDEAVPARAPQCE